MNLKNLLSFSFLLALILAAGSADAQSRATVLYVDASYTGSTSDGSATQPFKTIRAALDYRQNTLVPSGMVSDEEIVVKAGVYAPDSTDMVILTQYNGGYGNHWLTMRGEAGAIIDGANLYSKKFAALITVAAAAKNVRIEGFKLRNHRCNQSLASYQTINGSSVLVKDTKFGIQITNTGNNIQVINNEIYDFSWTVNVDPMKNRLDFTSTEINTLKTAAPNDNIGPINVVGTDSVALTNVLIKGNYVHHVIPGWTEGIQLNGNLNGFEVSENIIHEVQNIGIVAAGHYAWVPEIQGATVTASNNYSRNGVIRNNKVSSCRSPIATAAGIYCDGSKNMIVENNQVSDCQVGFSIGNENSNVNSGGHILRNNLSYGNSWTGLVVGVPAAASGSYIDSVKVTGNTIYGNGGVTDTYLGSLGSSQIVIQKEIKNLTIENNIFYATTTNTLVTFAMPFTTTSFISTIHFDYNLYYTNSTATPPLGTFDWSQLGSGYDYYGTYEWYRVQRSAQDVHSVFANPLFENASVADFRIQATSPAIDKGNPAYVATAGETDLFGNERVFGDTLDIGAYEAASVAAGDLAATIDGVKSSAEGYVALQTGLTTGVWDNIYAYDDNHFIYIYAEYDGTMPEYSVFVNINSSTGYQYTWSEKVDFYVDGSQNLLNKFSSSANSNWPFVADNNAMTVRFVKTSTTIEGRIPKEYLGVGNVGTIGLGLEGHSANWSSSLGTIPLASNSMVYLTLDGGNEAGSLSIDGYNSPVEAYNALTTGVTGSSFKNMYGTVDAEYIYLYAEIDNTNLREYDVYININSSTGYQYLWSEKSDFYIDGNYNQLNHYTGSGSWPFTESSNSAGIEFVMNHTAIEGKIPKALLGLGNTGTIGVAIEGHTANWGSSLGGVPTSGSMLYMSLDYGSGSRVASETSAPQLTIQEIATIYPNPASEFVMIQHEMKQAGVMQVEFIGLDGKSLMKWSGDLTAGQHELKLPLEAQVKGLVLVKVSDATGVTVSRLIVK